MAKIFIRATSEKCEAVFGQKLRKNKELEQKLDASLLQFDLDAIHFDDVRQPLLQAHHHGDHGHDKNRHGATIHSFCLKHDRPLPGAQIEAFLDHLSLHYATNILRLKGIVATLERRDQPLVVHGVQGFFHPPQWLQSWKGQAHETRLVVIADGISAAEIEAVFAAFTGQIGVDQADFQALSDNPLAITGLKF